MHDLCIVGAGPVGATLGLALADGDIDLLLLDARAAGATVRADRSLALSHGSRLILERLGAWAALVATPGAVTPIREVDVSQAGGFGVARLRACELGLPALGYVVSYVALQSALDARLALSRLRVLHGVSVAEVYGSPSHAEVVASTGETFAARLAAVADGTGASVTGIERRRYDYGQAAIVAKVWLDRPHEGIAYERFAPRGPIALLPEADHCALVWTMEAARAEQALRWPEAQFLDTLAREFGARVRGFARVAERKSFPLALEVSRPTVGVRAVVLGNAAQALHPVAAQGFNLGLRDAAELARIVLDAPRASIGAPAMLARHAAGRAKDRGAGIAFTHGLVHLFGSDRALVRWPRGIALAALDALPPLKRAFTRAMLFGLR